jgi:hypothetical protein
LTNSSIRVNGAGRERETFLEKGSPFLPRTPSIPSKNFRVITFFASAKTVIVFLAKLHKNSAVTTENIKSNMQFPAGCFKYISCRELKFLMTERKILFFFPVRKFIFLISLH